MWETIPWLVILLVIIHNSASATNNTKQVSTQLYSMQNINTGSDKDVEHASVQPPPTLIEKEKYNSRGNTNAHIVETKAGKVRGYETTDKKIWQFFDIPYAAFDAKYPFQEPVKHDSWKGVLEITEHTSLCPQLDSNGLYTGIPECLTLSVFTPQGIEKADVLLHVHDGDFIHGSGDPQVYGPGFLVPKQVILVLPNYRLGPLGFLCMGNSTAPGNAALKDLTMALNWTRENIEAFGGNPLNIVVSGTGTGAALAEYLALAPKSQDYVSKVITETGSVLSHWAIDRTPIETANKLLKILNNSEVEAPTNGNDDDVFINISLNTIIRAAKGITFRPCVEKSFITETPWDLLRDQKLNKSFMLGATDRAGLHKAMRHTEESVLALNNDSELLLPDDLAFEQIEEKKKAGKRVKIQYFRNETISLEHMNDLALFHTDKSYLSPGIRTARLLTTAESIVYFYEFSFDGNKVDSKTNIIHGAARGDSLKYVFQRGYEPVEGTQEHKMMNLMTTLWVNFIRTGKPTSEDSEWEQFKVTNESEEAWLSIDSEMERKKGFHLERLSLWTEIYKEHFIDNSTGHRVGPGMFSGWLVLFVCFLKPLHHSI